ncbi:MAG: TldD/PmbA family protein [Nitrospira sp.]|nr:TldD/PmbA family protein [Nitrospira sp.]
MSEKISKSWPKLTSREEFRFLSDLVVKRSTGDHTFISLQDQHGGTTRFANNQIIQNVDARRGALHVTVAFGARHGTAATTDFTAGAVQETVTRAMQIARLSPEDPEFLPPPEPQHYLAPPTSRAETAAAGPPRRLEYANEAIGHCRMENLGAAGLVSSAVATVGIAASTGLFAHEERTDARFSLTVQAGDATGWSASAHRSIDHLKVQDRTLTAINKATRSHIVRKLPPGRYPVILEPAAVAGLWSQLIQALDAKAYETGTSALSGRLGQRIVDQRLTLRNRPMHDDLFGLGFTSEGLPTTESDWITEGVLSQLAYDRFTAHRRGLGTIPTCDAPCLSGTGAALPTLQDLITRTEHAILVTNFWYIRTVNPTDLTLTGMTRDGTFLVENGEIVSAVNNFRFHESPLQVFNRLETYTGPTDAVTSETGKVLVPAMKLRDFHFSSVTRF